MADSPEEKSLKPMVRLISVEDSPGDRGKPRAYLVRMGFFDGDGEVQLDARFRVDRKVFDDTGVIPLARSWFSYLCGKLGEDTKDWRLDQSGFDAFKRPETTT